MVDPESMCVVGINNLINKPPTMYSWESEQDRESATQEKNYFLYLNNCVCTSTIEHNENQVMEKHVLLNNF